MLKAITPAHNDTDQRFVRAAVNHELENLEQQLRAKTLEIEAAVAQALVISAADATKEAENLIDGFDNAMTDGETPKEWQAHESRVTGIAIGKLLVQRYEIAEQIRDIQDEHLSE